MQGSTNHSLGVSVDVGAGQPPLSVERTLQEVEDERFDIVKNRGATRAERRAAEKARRRKGWGPKLRATNKPFEYREMI